MRKLARFLIVLATLLWVAGVVPAARACVASGVDASCCPVSASICHMDCCRQPVGNLQNGDVPATVRTPEMPAQPLALRVTVLSNLKPASIGLLAQVTPLESQGGVRPTKIYLLKRSLLI